MAVRSLILTSRIVAVGLLASAVTFAVPVYAERWQDVDHTNAVSVRLDIDSLKREGSEVTYRAEFTGSRPGSNTKRSVSIAVIDCDKGQRKGLETERFLLDGSSNKGSIDSGWRVIRPGSLTKKIQRLICSHPS